MKFDVVGTSKLGDSRFVIFGRIVEGGVSTGDSVTISLNRLAGPTLNIDQVKLMDLNSKHVTCDSVAFRDVEPESMELLESLEISGKLIDISPA